jgi:hypothetical protein
MQAVLRRLPAFDQILPVFAVIALFAYGRSLYVFAFKVPAWLLFQSPGEILSNLAYGLVFNFLESAFLLSLLLAVSILLPASYFKDNFIAHGTWAASVVLVSVWAFIKNYSAVGPDFGQTIYLWIGVTLVLSVLAAFLGGRIAFLKKAALWFADRVIILLFLFVPASALSLLALIVRNIF